MDSKLQKARRLFRVLADKKPLAVFTRMPDGRLMHAGKEISTRDAEQVSKQYDKSITILIKQL